MHRPTDTHRTAKDLSPEELAQYRRRLDQHLQNRKVDEALLQRAWQTAHQVATMLYEDFGATQVAVFGSLAEQDWFSKGSDIDIVAWGIPSDKYFRAVAQTIGFSKEFRIDLVSFENCKGHFRERIQSQTVPIQNSRTETNTKFATHIKRKDPAAVNKDRLIQRISEEHIEITQRVEKIRADLQKLEKAPVAYKESLEILIARHLYDFYKGLENIFRRIARDIDGNLPQGEEWHKALLKQMAEPRATRASILSEETCAELHKFLGFRHVFIYIYAEKLDYEQTLENAKRVNAVFPNISEELDVFISWLKRQESDE
ncbi:hypothetical protein F4009_07010 [Candidatus Poribacteria bacterium]|nr:hypothetical protein [Candidatus Poribacteria bacterium]MYK93739.1 hypothetical protein [Candidatus Poribacteria bacterium]